MKTLLTVVFLSVFVTTTPSFAIGFGGLKDKLDRSDKCDSDDKGCKNKEHLKAAARVAAISVAVKLLTDMVLDYKSQQVADEASVAEDYRAKNKRLQADPIASVYKTKTLPGEVVQPGKKVTITSEIVVVPGEKRREALIEERITIFDNEDSTKELRSLTKAVNSETRRGGRFENEFSFTPPQGLPQGVYPIKTELLLNGTSAKTSSNDIQLVLHVEPQGVMQVLAAAH